MMPTFILLSILFYIIKDNNKKLKKNVIVHEKYESNA